MPRAKEALEGVPFHSSLSQRLSVEFYERLSKSAMLWGGVLCTIIGITGALIASVITEGWSIPAAYGLLSMALFSAVCIGALLRIAFHRGRREDGSDG